MADCGTTTTRSLFVLMIANLALTTVTLSYVVRRPAAPEVAARPNVTAPIAPARVAKPSNGDVDKTGPQLALTSGAENAKAAAPSLPIARSPLAQDGEKMTKPLPYTQAAVVATTGAESVEASDATDASANSAPPVEGIIPWTKATEYVGRIITVEGRIVDTHNTGSVCFLNFDKNWQDKFYLIILPDAMDIWPEAPETHFLNKTIRVTGKVDLNKGRPQIKIRKKDQVVIVE